MYEHLVELGIFTEEMRAAQERYTLAYSAYYESDPVGPAELKRREIALNKADAVLSALVMR